MGGDDVILGAVQCRQGKVGIEGELDWFGLETTAVYKISASTMIICVS